MTTRDAIDWERVKAVVNRCMHGAPSGESYIPSRDESLLLDAARHADIDRYRTIHKLAKAEAVERMCGGWYALSADDES